VNIEQLPQLLIFNQKLVDLDFLLLRLLCGLRHCNLHDISHVLNLGFELHPLSNSFISLLLELVNSHSVQLNKFFISLFFLILKLDLLVLVQQEHEGGLQIIRVVCQNLVVEVQVIDQVTNEHEVISFKWRQLPDFPDFLLSLHAGVNLELAYYVICLDFNFRGFNLLLSWRHLPLSDIVEASESILAWSTTSA